MARGSGWILCLLLQPLPNVPSDGRDSTEDMQLLRTEPTEAGHSICDSFFMTMDDAVVNIISGDGITDA